MELDLDVVMKVVALRWGDSPFKVNHPSTSEGVARNPLWQARERAPTMAESRWHPALELPSFQSCE